MVAPQHEVGGVSLVCFKKVPHPEVARERPRSIGKR